jgi:Domain of unknown function (DUF1816)
MHDDNLFPNPPSTIVQRVAAKPIADLGSSDSSSDGKRWWIEIVTTNPKCIYYFGPFHNSQEAETMRLGYIEDLQAEGAKDIQAIVKYCNPKQLTVFEEGC